MVTVAAIAAGVVWAAIVATSARKVETERPQPADPPAPERHTAMVRNRARAKILTGSARLHLEQWDRDLPAWPDDHPAVTDE
jgi:hypothetical protein